MLNRDTPRKLRVWACSANQGDKGVPEKEYQYGKDQRCQKDKGQYAFGPIQLHGGPAADLGSQEKEYGEDRGLLENFDDQADKLPLGDNGQAAGVGQFVANQVNAIELVDVGQADKEEDKEKEPPVPGPEAMPQVVEHKGPTFCRGSWVGLDDHVIPRVAEESKNPARSQGQAFQIPRLPSE